MNLPIRILIIGVLVALIVNAVTSNEAWAPLPYEGLAEVERNRQTTTYPSIPRDIVIGHITICNETRTVCTIMEATFPNEAYCRFAIEKKIFDILNKEPDSFLDLNICHDL